MVVSVSRLPSLILVNLTRLAAAALLLLAACDGDELQSALPLPLEPDREAMGYYCSMIVVDHGGPKAQVFLTSTAKPIWFTSVRDAIAFTLLPEEPKNVAAIYVNDMGQGPWEQPAPGTWIDATAAWYVIGSRRRGGMGALEAVPFTEPAAAETFAASEGGEVVAYAAIPRAYILAPPEDEVSADPLPSVGRGEHGSGAMDHMQSGQTAEMPGMEPGQTMEDAQ